MYIYLHTSKQQDTLRSTHHNMFYFSSIWLSIVKLHFWGSITYKNKLLMFSVMSVQDRSAYFLSAYLEGEKTRNLYSDGAIAVF